MQPLQQEIEPAPPGLTTTGHPVLRGLMADQSAAHAEEVRLLRQRVAMLESALEAARAAPAGSALTDLQAASVAVTSEFCEPAAPAVVAVSTTRATPAPVEEEPVAAEQTAEHEVLPDQGFANAWTDDVESSFEERIAQKAFFQVGSVDEQSRKWLLTS